VCLSTIGRDTLVIWGEGVDRLLDRISKKTEASQSVSVTQYPCVDDKVLGSFYCPDPKGSLARSCARIEETYLPVYEQSTPAQSDAKRWKVPHGYMV
jgi:hypothetical protein